MFESEMRIEVERRLQKACDERAIAGLPPPLNIEAFRAIVRNDLIREIEAARVAPKVVTKPKPKPKTAAPPILKRQATPRQVAMGRLIELADKKNLREPVHPALYEPAKRPVRAVDPDEMAVRAILEASRLARGR